MVPEDPDDIWSRVDAAAEAKDLEALRIVSFDVCTLPTATSLIKDVRDFTTTLCQRLK